jgi:hypothetical protein
MSALQGCADMAGLSWVNDRWGPSPVLVAAASADAAGRQVAVVNAMILATSGMPARTDPAGRVVVPTPIGKDGWYITITAGFNVIDDACQTYLDDLWKLDRERSAATGIIAATGAAVAAVVNRGGGGTATTLVILAQAFGLAGTLTTNLANTYLYAKDPATVKGLVDKLMDAYRQDFHDKVYGNIANNIAAPTDDTQYPIQSYPAAYYRMREYLSLCLPPTIDAQVQTLLSNATAGAKAPAGVTPAGSAPGTEATQNSLSKVQVH